MNDGAGGQSFGQDLSYPARGIWGRATAGTGWHSSLLPLLQLSAWLLALLQPGQHEATGWGSCLYACR